MGNDLDLAIALLGDGNGLAEVSGAALDLDAVVQELLKGLDVEDLVVDGLRAVDDELLGDLLALLCGGTAGCALLWTYFSLLFCARERCAQPGGQQSGGRTVEGIVIAKRSNPASGVRKEWLSKSWPRSSRSALA